MNYVLVNCCFSELALYIQISVVGLKQSRHHNHLIKCKLLSSSVEAIDMVNVIHVDTNFKFRILPYIIQIMKYIAN
jgi:hypothetical protein